MKIQLKGWQFYVLGVIATLLNTLAMLGLWDIIRHQLELKTGFYDLPFAITVPWFIAGDLFVTMGVIAMILYLIAVVADEVESPEQRFLPSQ